MTAPKEAPPAPSISIYEAIAQVALEVGAVGKNQRMESGPARYSYRGLDDLMDAVHEPLARNSVTFAPHSIQVTSEMEKTTKSGSIQHHIRAIVTYRIYGPAGDFIEAAVLAEGADTGDKAGNKLMSGALKYAIGQTLSIPYSMEDQDATNPEPVVTATPAEIVASIQRSAERLGKGMDEVTAKLREEHGGIGTDELLAVPDQALSHFAVRLAAYASKNGG